MKQLAITTMILLFSVSGYSQTIINAERFGSGVDSTVYALTFTYTGSRGNLNTDRLGAAPAFVMRRGANDLKLFGGYAFFRNAGNTIIHNGFIHLRHNYSITERLKTYEYYQIQFNERLLLTNRQVFGGGLRYKIVDKHNLYFNLGGGLMREYEQLNEEKLHPGEISETKYTRLGILSSFEVNIGNAKFNNVLYYQPYLKDFRDFRCMSDMSLSFNIIEHFDFITTLTTRYDSQPPDDLVKFDNLLSVGITMKF